MKEKNSNMLVYDPENTYRDKQRKNKLIKSCVKIGILAIIACIFIFAITLNGRQAEKVISTDLVSSSEFFYTQKAEQEKLFYTLDKLEFSTKSISYDLDVDNGFNFYSLEAVEEFTTNYDNIPIKLIVHFTIDYRFKTGDVNFFNQKIDNQDAIIVKPNYNNLITEVNIKNIVSDYAFKNDNEKSAFSLKIADKIAQMYELSDNELNNKLSSFFKEHFFFIKDKYRIAIMNKQNPED